MHVHILTKVCDQKQGDQVSIKLCIGGGAYRGSKVDINSCTDACKHSNQGV